MQILQAEYEKIVQNPFSFPRRTDSYLIFLTKSAFLLDCDGKKLQKKEGQLMLCPPGFLVQITPCDKSGVVDFVVFSVTSEEERMLRTIPLPQNKISAPPHFSELSALIKSIDGIAGSADKYRLEKTAHYLMILLYCIASGDEAPTEQSRAGVQFYRLRKLRRSLSDKPEQHPTVAEAAAYVGLCESRFSALYQQYFGVSYISDLIRTRIRRSCAILETTDWTVAKIAAELGYENESNFYRQFRQQIGISPTQYRKMLEKGSE